MRWVACLRRGPGPARRLSSTRAKTTPVRTGLRPPGGPCPGAYNGRAALHLARLFIPCQDPHGASSLIRDVSGEGNLGPKGQRVHVDAADHIPMPCKGTLGVAAAPLAPRTFCFQPHTGHWLLVPRSEPVKLSMLAAVGFVGEVGDVLPVFPPGHSLVVMASAVPLAHAIWVADEEACPRRCCWQKVITLRVPWWRRSRICRRLRALTCAGRPTTCASVATPAGSACVSWRAVPAPCGAAV